MVHHHWLLLVVKAKSRVSTAASLCATQCAPDSVLHAPPLESGKLKPVILQSVSNQ